jgi:hypothetical protein
MVAFAQLLGEAAALDQFLETAQRGAKRLAVMDTHS